MALNTIPINEFSGSQHTLVADRVILNSVLDDLYLISAKNIIFGSLGEMHINSKGDVYINTSGSSKIIKGNPEGIRNGAQPDVLGSNTYKLLTKLISILSTFQVDTASGPGITSQATLEALNSLKDAYLDDTNVKEYILSDFCFTSNNLEK